MMETSLIGDVTLEELCRKAADTLKVGDRYSTRLRRNVSLRLSPWVALDLFPAAYTLEGDAFAAKGALTRQLIKLMWHMSNPKLTQDALYTPRTLSDVRDAQQRGLCFTTSEGTLLDSDTISAYLPTGEEVPLYLNEVIFNSTDLATLCFVPGEDPLVAHPATTQVDAKTGKVFDSWSYALRTLDLENVDVTHPADTVCLADCENCQLMCMREFSKHAACSRWASTSEIGEAKTSVAKLSERLQTTPSEKVTRDLAKARANLASLQPCSEGREGFECPCKPFYTAVQLDVSGHYRSSTKSSVKAPLRPVDGGATVEPLPLWLAQDSSGAFVPLEDPQ